MAAEASTDPAVLGVDVGGTAIKARLLVGGTGPGRHVEGVPTPRGDPTGVAVADAVAALVARAGDVTAVGLAVPGIVDDAAGTCRLAVNLGWRDVPVRDLVAERIGAPVVLTQDVRAGARAEQVSGAGAGRTGGLLFAPLGTGLAVAGVDDAGRSTGGPWAGEVGQLRYGAGPHAGLRVEDVVSAGGLARRFGAPDALTVLHAVRSGDERAAALWTDTAEALAELLAWAVALTAPGTIVIGGGLAGAGAALLDPVRRALGDRLPGFPVPVVLPAAHGAAAAALGAALLARASAADARGPA